MVAPILPDAQPRQPIAVPKCGARGEKRAFLFVPQSDITAPELAAATEILIFGFAVMIRAAPPQLVDQLYDALDAQAKRHWLANDLPQVVAVQKSNNKGGLRLPPGAR